MKALNLLKMLPRNQPQTSTVGFTMFELMVVVVIIGILSAIAVPGWNAFINNQRTRTVNDAVFRALRSAQSDAKLKKKDITVTFKDDEDPPVVIINNIAQTLNANGEIKAGMVELVTGVCDTNCTTFNPDPPTDSDITFNYLGTVENTQALPFAITVSTANDGFKRCIIVETLLGGIRTAKDSNCP